MIMKPMLIAAGGTTNKKNAKNRDY